MKLLEICRGFIKSSENPSEAQIKTAEGYVKYGWKSDLEDEEHAGYIPDGYSKEVLELQMISVNNPGNGDGDKLMKQFLQTPEAQAAELIFLDPFPGQAVNADSAMSDDEQVNKLQKFYRRFGFKNNPQSNRMWLVQKGSIPANRLPV